MPLLVVRGPHLTKNDLVSCKPNPQTAVVATRRTASLLHGAFRRLYVELERVLKDPGDEEGDAADDQDGRQRRQQHGRRRRRRKGIKPPPKAKGDKATGEKRKRGLKPLLDVNAEGGKGAGEEPN